MATGAAKFLHLNKHLPALLHHYHCPNPDNLSPSAKHRALYTLCQQGKQVKDLLRSSAQQPFKHQLSPHSAFFLFLFIFLFVLMGFQRTLESAWQITRISWHGPRQDQQQPSIVWTEHHRLLEPAANLLVTRFPHCAALTRHFVRTTCGNLCKSPRSDSSLKANVTRCSTAAQFTLGFCSIMHSN